MLARTNTRIIASPAIGTANAALLDGFFRAWTDSYPLHASSPHSLLLSNSEGYMFLLRRHQHGQRVLAIASTIRDQHFRGVMPARVDAAVQRAGARVIYGPLMPTHTSRPVAHRGGTLLLTIEGDSQRVIHELQPELHRATVVDVTEWANAHMGPVMTHQRVLTRLSEAINSRIIAVRQAQQMLIQVV